MTCNLETKCIWNCKPRLLESFCREACLFHLKMSTMFAFGNNLSDSNKLMLKSHSSTDLQGVLGFSKSSPGS